MTLNDPLADSLSKINNTIKALYRKVTLKKSKLLLEVLNVLKEQNYIKSYEIIEDGRQGLVEVELLGTINECGVIKPRYSLTVSEIETFEKDFLPAKDFGVIIISTSKGLLTQSEAKKQHVGGMVVAYCY